MPTIRIDTGVTTEPWAIDPKVPLPPDVQGLIFDLDGTLVDTMGMHYRAWTAALAGTDLVLPEDRFYSMAGSPTEKIAEMLCREAGLTIDLTRIVANKQRHYLAHLSEIKRIGSVVALAEREKSRRKIAVATGGHRHIVIQQLAAANLTNLFEIVVCAEDVRHGKPSPDTFLETARRMGVAPAQCIVYEDAVLGFQAARMAGMKLVDVRLWPK